jgi:hypothetical protein
MGRNPGFQIFFRRSFFDIAIAEIGVSVISGAENSLSLDHGIFLGSCDRLGAITEPQAYYSDQEGGGV